MILTARQLKYMAEIEADDRAADATLRIALSYHANQMNILEKERVKFWDDLAETHGFDLDKCRWEIEKVDGAWAVVPSKDQE